MFITFANPDIWNKIEQGLSIRALVPDPVALYIKQHSPYALRSHISHKRQLHENHRVI